MPFSSRFLNINSVANLLWFCSGEGNASFWSSVVCCRTEWKRVTVSSSHLAGGIIACRLYLRCEPGTGSAANPSLYLVVLCRHLSKIARLHELFSLILRNLLIFRSICELPPFTLLRPRRIQVTVSWSCTWDTHSKIREGSTVCTAIVAPLAWIYLM